MQHCDLIKDGLYEQIETAEQAYQSVTGMQVYTPAKMANFILMVSQLNKLNLSYRPIADVKTFNQWKQAGLQVKKGEKAVLYTVVWKIYDQEKNKETGKIEKVESDVIRPVIVPVFHRGQVKPAEKTQEEQDTETWGKPESEPARPEQTHSVLSMF